MLTTLFALVALVGLVTVGFVVRRLIRLAGRSVVCRVPLLAEQRVELPQPGPMVLYAPSHGVARRRGLRPIRSLGVERVPGCVDAGQHRLGPSRRMST